MADNIYKCPQCNVTLKPAQAIAPGKKIKCPKCQHIFAPTGESQPVGAARPVAARPKPAEDDDVGTYGFKEEAAPPPPSLPALDEPDDDDGEQPKTKKKKAAAAADDDLLEKKYPKSRKGAAQAICQKPTNQMLMTSSFACASCLISLLLAMWPIIFAKERDWNIDLLGFSGYRLILGAFIVAAFAYNGVIAMGAVKIQAIESAAWGMIASMMCIIPLSWALAVPAFAWWFKLIEKILEPGHMFVWIGLGVISLWYVYVGLWNLKTLRDPDVLAAFNEPQANYDD